MTIYAFEGGFGDEEQWSAFDSHSRKSQAVSDSDQRLIRALSSLTWCGLVEFGTIGEDHDSHDDTAIKKQKWTITYEGEIALRDPEEYTVKDAYEVYDVDY